MKSINVWLGPVLGLLSAAGVSQAWYRSPALQTPLGYAPDACGPGFYTVCPNGYAFGPNYCVYPGCQPFGGLLPPDKAKLLQDLQGRGINHQADPQGKAGQGNGPGAGPGGGPTYGMGPGGGPGYGMGPGGGPGYRMGPGGGPGYSTVPPGGLQGPYPPGYTPPSPYAGSAPPPGFPPNQMPPGYAPNSPVPGYTPYGVPLPNPGYSPPMPVQPPPAFPSHPFARGPRDFFMWSDVMQDKIARAQRPSLVP